MNKKLLLALLILSSLLIGSKAVQVKKEKAHKAYLRLRKLEQSLLRRHRNSPELKKMLDEKKEIARAYQALSQRRKKLKARLQNYLARKDKNYRSALSGLKVAKSAYRKARIESIKKKRSSPMPE